MSYLLLPLVESLVNDYKGSSFARTKVIGVQHILETTHAMFRSLYKIGLPPENISIIGKCYSTSLEVYEEMQADGIDISPGSLVYSSHLPFDEQFSGEVARFLGSHLDDLRSNRYESIIVLDDGGQCIKFLSDHLGHEIAMIGIEQTTAGYEAIRTITLPFPVINVARSPVKLNLESPMIANAAAERLYSSLKQKDILPDRALIIGGGAIGQAMRERLSPNLLVRMYDSQAHLSDFSNLAKIIHDFPLIIGCTGKTSLPQDLHPLLLPGTSLVSVSSSDREFAAVHLRKLIPKNHECHQDLMINGLLLVNSGFPVNFDGSRENIDPLLIQLTTALITAAIIQARNLPDVPPGIIPVTESLEQKVVEEFSGLAILPS